MAEKWHDFPLTAGPEMIGVAGFIGGEHTYGYYIAAPQMTGAIAQIVDCPKAAPGDDPPPEFQAPSFHHNQPVNTTEPRVVFGSDGVCTSAGYTAGGDWYNVGDKTEHPSGGGPVATAKAEALANLLSWVHRYESL